MQMILSKKQIELYNDIISPNVPNISVLGSTQSGKTYDICVGLIQYASALNKYEKEQRKSLEYIEREYCGAIIGWTTDTVKNNIVNNLENILTKVYHFTNGKEYELKYGQQDKYLKIYNITFYFFGFNNKLSFEALTEIFKDGVNRSPGRIILETPEIVSIIMFSVIGIVSSILLIKLNKEDKAENSMQVSNSWFSYKTMIPIYFSMICLTMCENSELVGFIFLFVGTYVAYVIYRRTLKIKKWDIIVIGICFVSMIIIYILYENYKSGLPLIKELTPPVSNIIRLLN
jgi:hypothetical protein